MWPGEDENRVDADRVFHNIRIVLLTCGPVSVYFNATGAVIGMKFAQFILCEPKL